MPEFLQLHSIEQARQKFLDWLPVPKRGSETVETYSALGRVLSESVLSPEDSPAFNRSTVDGYAVRAADTFGASDSLPAYLHLAGEVKMGEEPKLRLVKGDAALIHTGGMLPEQCDAVVMLEHSQLLDNGDVETYKGVSKHENVLLRGEDVTVGSEVLKAGKRVRPEEIAALLALGITKVSVYQKPVVSILSSGDEVIPPEQKPGIGQVRDINSHGLAALVVQAGGIPRVQTIVPDDPQKLEEAIHSVYGNSDLVIITAGSSASERDMTAEVISRFGQPGVLVHGVNVKPGKPTILAVCDGKPMIGLPGNPVSAMVIARLFVLPLIGYLSGIVEIPPQPAVTAKLTINVASQSGRDDYFPVVLINKAGEWQAEPVFFKSNLIFSLARANGLLHIPADVTGYATGDRVEVNLI